MYRILKNPIYIGKISHKGEIHNGQHPAIIDMPLWNAVQQQLRNQTNGKRRENTQIPKLLAGLLFDAQGAKLTPTYSKKGTRLYQYYVSNDLHQGQRTDGDQFRIPALELEQAVLDALIGWLEDERHFLSNAEIINPAQVLASATDAVRQLKDPNTQHDALRSLVQRVTVHPNRLEIQMSMDGVTSKSIEISIHIKRSGLAVRLIVGDEVARPHIDKKLLALITKAFRWFELLESGKCESLAALGKREGVSSGYVSRAMKLAFLSPEILQIIAQGKQPEHVTSDRLMRMGMPPVNWEEQWRWLGMSAGN